MLAFNKTKKKPAGIHRNHFTCVVQELQKAFVFLLIAIKYRQSWVVLFCFKLQRIRRGKDLDWESGNNFNSESATKFLYNWASQFISVLQAPTCKLILSHSLALLLNSIICSLVARISYNTLIKQNGVLTDYSLQYFLCTVYYQGDFEIRKIWSLLNLAEADCCSWPRGSTCSYSTELFSVLTRGF